METRKRLIFHIDVNSAFLSWESVYRLSQDPDAQDLRLIPSAVGGDVSSRDGIILAKSTPAKVRRRDGRNHRLCPAQMPRTGHCAIPF